MFASTMNKTDKNQRICRGQEISRPMLQAFTLFLDVNLQKITEFTKKKSSNTDFCFVTFSVFL